MPTLARSDETFVLDLGDDENRIDPGWLDDVAAALEEVAAAPAPRALVTTGSGKFFSFGLDLGWIAANRDRGGELSAGMHAVFASMLELPAPTVAALQGHAIAGGGLFALVHDKRVMRADRGWFCLPEVDVRIAFTPGLIDLVGTRLAPQVAHDALTTGRRWGGPEALAAGIVDEVADAGDVLPRAIELARSLATKDPATYARIRTRLYRRLIASLRDRDANAVGPEQFAGALEIARAAQA